jgi:hypothetical protein
MMALTGGRVKDSRRSRKPTLALTPDTPDRFAHDMQTAGFSRHVKIPISFNRRCSRSARRG